MSGPAAPIAWTPPVRKPRNSSYGAGNDPKEASLALASPCRPSPGGIGCWARAAASVCPIRAKIAAVSAPSASGTPMFASASSRSRSSPASATGCPFFEIASATTAAKAWSPAGNEAAAADGPDALV